MKKEICIVFTVLGAGLTTQLCEGTPSSQGVFFYTGNGGGESRFDINVYDHSDLGLPNAYSGAAYGGSSAGRYDLINGNLSTVSDGSGGFVAGGIGTTVLTLTNRVDGYISKQYWNWENLSSLHLIVDATADGTVNGDNPMISSLTGSKAPDPRYNRNIGHSYAIFTNNRNPNFAVGHLSLIEGNYFGSDEVGAAFLSCLTKVNITGSSFVSGNTSTETRGFMDDGGSVHDLDSRAIFFNPVNGILSWDSNDGEEMDMTINNRTSFLSRKQILESYNDLAFRDVLIGGESDADAVHESVKNEVISANGGNGLYLSDLGNDGVSSKKLTIYGGDFFGGDSKANITIAPGVQGGSINAAAFVEGGSGVIKVDAGKTVIHDGQFVGGHSGVTAVYGENSAAFAGGGRGVWLSGNADIGTGVYAGGAGGRATVTGPNGLASAGGGHGIQLNGGTVTIDDVLAKGHAGGAAVVSGSAGRADAGGGHGVYAVGTTLTIGEGSYSGARGGEVSAVDASADGGSGVYIENGTLTLHGGTYSGGDAGSVDSESRGPMQGYGIRAENSSVVITGNQADTVIHDGIYFSNSGNDLTLQSAHVIGDLILSGAGDTELTVSSNAVLEGQVLQLGGVVRVELSDPGGSAFFKDTVIDGTMEFTNAFRSVAGTSFTLNNNSSITFTELELNEGSGIDVGYGAVNVVSGNLVLGNESRVSLLYDGLSGNQGSIDVSGALIMTNQNSTVSFHGTAVSGTGSVQVISAGSATDIGNNRIEDLVDIDLGWLVKTNHFELSQGLRVDYEYNSISNSSLRDIDAALLPLIDDAISALDTTNFYMINAQGEAGGIQGIRYAAEQLPDVVDVAFEANRTITDQLFARSSMLRKMNGFDSYEPESDRIPAPAGVAGPEKEKSLQAWIRGYGAGGERDEAGNFSGYDATTFGTIIGVDKHAGCSMVGLAGGYAQTEIKAEDSYETESDLYHGSVYASLCGQRSYLDLSLTYAGMETEEESLSAEGEFDGMTISGYLGGGRTFSAWDRISITPGISLLTTYYNQDAYTRSDMLLGDQLIDSYDATSFLGSIGADFSAAHPVDFVFRGFSYMPKLRIHWLHEFNNELDPGSYSLASDPGAGNFPLYVRARQEDLLRLGVGFDIWHWSKLTHFKVDYDGLFSREYSQHMISGKLAVEF